MSFLIYTFVSAGYLALVFGLTLEAITAFIMAITVYLFISFIEYAQMQLRTNQFIDGQHSSIEQYNEDTKQ